MTSEPTPTPSHLPESPRKPIPDPSFGSFTFWLWLVLVPVFYILIPLGAHKLLPPTDGQPHLLKTFIFVIALPFQVLTFGVIVIWAFGVLLRLFQPPAPAIKPREISPLFWRLGIYRLTPRARQWMLGWFLVSLLVSSVTILSIVLPIWLRVVIALGATTFLGFTLWQIWKSQVEETDELQKLILNGAAHFTYSGLIAVITCFTLLDGLGVMPGFRWNSYQLLFLLIGLYYLGAFLTSRRYR